jgi:hypothetical protein
MFGCNNEGYHQRVVARALRPSYRRVMSFWWWRSSCSCNVMSETIGFCSNTAHKQCMLKVVTWLLHLSLMIGSRIVRYPPCSTPITATTQHNTTTENSSALPPAPLTSRVKAWQPWVGAWGASFRHALPPFRCDGVRRPSL